ncbi:hypothetical protein [Actinoallomurus sp. CA-142502]|uniref:hypothetical protein n=1 Tax=Actinoallomurus sp. CA-142502 TaxID=3239885 RepID=UPI003D942004
MAVPGGGWDRPDRWRLGRRDGRPVAAVAEFATDLRIHCAVTGDLETYDVLEGEPHGPGLLAVDDRAGPTLAVVARRDGAVWCWDLTTEAAYCPPLTGCPGAPNGARLGRWRDRPVAALLTDTGVSLYDLRDRSWIGHVGLGAKAHDVAFAPRGELVIVSAHGTLVVRPMP